VNHWGRERLERLKAQIPFAMRMFIGSHSLTQIINWAAILQGKKKSYGIMERKGERGGKDEKLLTA